MILLATLKYGIVFLLMASKPSHSNDLDYSKMEEILISTMEDIRSEVIYLQKDLKQVKVLVHALDVKSESCNATGSLTNIALEKISSHTEDIKEILTKKEKTFGNDTHLSGTFKFETNETEKPQLPFGNDTQLNELFNFGINITGEKNHCNGFPRTFLSIVNDLYHISIDQLENVVFNFKTCWKGIPKSMEGHTYFVTPSIHGGQIRSYCQSQDAKPFIPKSPEEFLFYIVAATRYSFSWYPLNDIDEEGNEVLLDSTDYKTSIFRLEKWEPGQGQRNDEQNDCVRVNIFGVSSWSKCHIRYRSICERN